MPIPSRTRPPKRTARTAGTLTLAVLGLSALAASGRVSAAPVAADAASVPAASAFRALTGHIPDAVRQAQAVSSLDSSLTLPLVLTLPLRHRAELADLLRGQADPSDARYGQFLTPQQFADRFSPTQADYDRAIAYAKSVGLTVVATHPNRTVLDVSAPAGQAERAFGLHLLVYQSGQDGRFFFAPDAEPRIPSALAAVVSGVVGLDNAAQWQPHFRLRPEPAISPFLDPSALPLQTGSGPGGGLAPSDIKKAYNLAGVSQTGSGQTLGLFELDGYKSSDITAYETKFGQPAVPLQNILVDGYSGAAGSGAGEVTLDIELQAALAPSATKIVVYEGPNSNTGVVDTYNKIATDNLAKQISTSWGEPENAASASVRNSENAAFQQMASQGQSIFAAAGDSGAYDDKSTLSVDDPASQPYMTGVGGTALTTAGAGGAYSSEKTWNGGSVANGGGGGGISTVWPIPSYQSGVVSAASKGSTTMRNVPDVSLDADPNTGYAIYSGGAWVVYGGTSCAAPLWAAFTALVNQQRAANGLGTLGFANTPIYAAAKGANYAADFHDIADGSTNLYYPAVAGYDDATGWGTFNGANLLADLSGTPAAPTAPAAPTGLAATPGNAQVSLAWNGSTGAASYNLYRATAAGAEGATPYKTGLTKTSYVDTGLTNGTTYFYQVAAVNSVGTSGKSSEASAKPAAQATTTQLLGNPGFENGAASPAPWVVSTGVIDNSAGEAAHSGAWKAWLDGYGSAHTDTLAQTVTLPATLTTATLGFYLHIDTAETTTTAAYDTLRVQLRSSSGTVLKTLGTFSNLNAATGYTLRTFDVSAYKGQTVQVYLVGIEDSSLQTSFVVDDFALNVQ